MFPSLFLREPYFLPPFFAPAFSPGFSCGLGASFGLASGFFAISTHLERRAQSHWRAKSLKSSRSKRNENLLGYSVNLVAGQAQLHPSTLLSMWWCVWFSAGISPRTNMVR